MILSPSPVNIKNTIRLCHFFPTMIDFFFLFFVALLTFLPPLFSLLAVMDKDLSSAKALYEQMQQEGIHIDELSLKRLAVLYRNAQELVPFSEPPVSHTHRHTSSGFIIDNENNKKNQTLITPCCLKTLQSKRTGLEAFILECR